MQDIFCPQCRLSQPAAHAFCVRCGGSLPAHLLEDSGRVKAARYFPGVKVSDGDPEGAFLRVTCYLKEQVFESPEGSVTIPGRHVRFSVWVGNEARCVMSIPESEARDLAAFVTDELGRAGSAVFQSGGSPT
ncbi:MAG: hypothetical protein M3198_15685 [Actinomycetota bacterium]|nr:hypothetical protein [Actinomycetota bacterium]